MGIPRLTSFVDNAFTGWQREEVAGNLIIDGYSMCYSLYSFDWSHGGQYPEYRDKVTHFFISLSQSGITPIVVMDGIDYKEEKTATILRRRSEVVKTIHKHTANMQKRNIEAVVDNVLPSLAISVFFLVMTNLKVKFIVADGEGDTWIYQLANAYACPVLSSDSDFLMFKLRAGYIPFNRFHWEASPINAEVFYYRAFCEQFNFKDESVRLLIPAIVGNDFITAVDPLKFTSHIARKVSMETKGLNRLNNVVKYVQLYQSLWDFVSQIDLLLCLENDEKRRLRENCRAAQELYDSEDVTSLEKMANFTDLRAFNSESLPDWVLKQFREGNFSSTFMEALVVGKAMLDVHVDNTAITSCVNASLSIRQFMYGLTGSSLVTEFCRQGLEIVGKGIHSSDSINGHPLPSLDRIPTMSPVIREQLLCSMLGGDFHMLQSLPPCWKLVMAATMFWWQHASPPPHLVKALILSFMVCATCPYETPKMRSEFFIPVAFRRSANWMPPLHMFSQWQSIYGDTMALNQLLMLPLVSMSPAQLYDGKLAMFFALPENGDHLVAMLPINHQLYAELVGTIIPFSPFVPVPPPQPPRMVAKMPPPPRRSNQPPRFQNAAAKGRGADGDSGWVSRGGGRGGGGGRGRGGEGGGRGRGRRRSSSSGSDRGGQNQPKDSPEQRNLELKDSNRGQETRGRGNNARRAPGSNQVLAQANYSGGKGARGARGQSRGGSGGGRGVGAPRGKVVLSTPPKFAHANRYAALEDEEDFAGSDSSESD